MSSGELQFNEAIHRYTLNGRIIPSVTQIITSVGLYEYDYVSSETLAIAAERGRFVHSMIEWHEQGELDESTIDPELQGYFDAYLEMKASGAITAKADLIEARVYSEKYQYAGTLDMEFLNEKWIHDHKTGEESPVHGLQLSGYWLAKHPDFRDKPEHLTCGYYRKDGTWNLVEYPYEPFAWLSILADFQWRLKNNLIKARWLQSA